MEPKIKGEPDLFKTKREDFGCCNRLTKVTGGFSQKACPRDVYLMHFYQLGTCTGILARNEARGDESGQKNVSESKSELVFHKNSQEGGESARPDQQMRRCDLPIGHWSCIVGDGKGTDKIVKVWKSLGLRNRAKRKKDL